MISCIACGRGFHRECGRCKKGKCHTEDKQDGVSVELPSPENAASLQDTSGKKAATPKEPKKYNLKDPASTGRKRAAKLYPLDRDAPCEWRGLRNCGGGRRPIIGCLDGTQKHRHHGPVKSTTRNELGNVHRICTDCHVHWHELNDLIYNEPDYNLLPHQPSPATDIEVIQNKLDWTTGKMGQMFELASSKNLEKHHARSASSTAVQSHDLGEE